MHELPISLQNTKGRPVSGEDLETMGKHAASLYQRGKSLNDSVVETVKHAGLNTEQVCRVVEFANHAAFAHEFRKEGAAKYVSFDGGPADPAVILQDLNDGGGGAVYDRGRNDDYALPPSFHKTASSRTEEGLDKIAHAFSPVDSALEAAFAVQAAAPMYADPLHEAWQAHQKLAGLRDQQTYNLSMLELGMEGVVEDLYHHVKTASLKGLPLGHVLQAWAEVAPGPGYVKLAFEQYGPRLLKEAVLMSGEALGESLMKTASVGMVNTKHPLVGGFAAFCAGVDKLAEARAELADVVDAYKTIDDFIVKTSGIAETMKGLAGEGGLIPKAWRGAKGLAEQAAPHVGDAAAAVIGPNARKAAETATKYVPHALAAVGAKELYDRGVKYGPGQLPIRYAKSHVPGTREYYAREIGMQQSPFPM